MKFKVGDRVMINTKRFDDGISEPEFGKIGTVTKLLQEDILLVQFAPNVFRSGPAWGQYDAEDIIIDPTFNTPLDKALRER